MKCDEHFWRWSTQKVGDERGHNPWQNRGLYILFVVVSIKRNIFTGDCVKQEDIVQINRLLRNVLILLTVTLNKIEFSFYNPSFFLPIQPTWAASLAASEAASLAASEAASLAASEAAF